MFLGVFLDENLSWKSHIADIPRKVSKSIGIIYKASLCPPTSVLYTLCYSLVYPYLLYCITAWGSTYPSTLRRIVLFQEKVVRIISRSTEPIFKQLKILNLYNIYRLQIGKIMFSFKIDHLDIVSVFEQQSLLLHQTMQFLLHTPLQNKYQTFCVIFPRT